MSQSNSPETYTPDGDITVLPYCLLCGVDRVSSAYFTRQKCEYHDVRGNDLNRRGEYLSYVSTVIKE